MKNHIFYLVFFCYSSAMIGQELLFPYDADLAVFQQEKGIQIHGLHFRGEYYHSAFAPTDILQKEGNTTTFSFRPVVDQLSSLNTGVGDFSLRTLQLDYFIEDLKFSVGHRIRSVGSIRYSKELATMSALGNAVYIGEMVNAGPDLELLSYHEIYLGVAKKWDHIKIGARIKYLAGNDHVFSPEDRIVLTIDPDYYRMQFDNNYQITGTGVFDYNGLDDLSFDFDGLKLEPFARNNQGLALDFSFNMDISETSLIGIEVHDLGSIHWNNNVSSFVSAGEMTYEGIDLLDYLNDGDDISISDSLYQLLEFEEIEVSQYSRRLPVSWQLYYAQSLKNGYSFYTMIRGKSYGQSQLLMVGGGIQLQINDYLFFGANYSVVGSSFDNLGVFGKVYAGPVTIRAGIDNVLSIPDLLGSKYNSISMAISIGI